MTGEYERQHLHKLIFIMFSTKEYDNLGVFNAAWIHGFIVFNLFTLISDISRHKQGEELSSDLDGSNSRDLL